MTVALLAGVVGVVLAAPYRLRLDDQPPMLAALVWMLALALRAVLVVFTIVVLVVVLPQTGVVAALTHWCWHAVLPLLTTHLDFNGHDVWDAAVLLPVVILVASAASVGIGVWRAARAVRRLLAAALTGGPRDSLIIGDRSILVAAAGLRRPRVVVSAGALTALDDAELFASLDHERGHIQRRHRWVLVLAEVLRSLARPVPGTRRAAGELAYHLERDADWYAVERQHEPAALARAICKAAQGDPWLCVTALTGGGASRRVRQLLDDAPPRRASAACRVLALATVTVVVAMVAALPSATMAAIAPQPGDAQALRHC